VSEDEILIVHVERPVYWFDGPVAELPPRVPFISPELLELAEDES
jgi:hypothetical protein